MNNKLKEGLYFLLMIGSIVTITILISLQWFQDFSKSENPLIIVIVSALIGILLGIFYVKSIVKRISYISGIERFQVLRILIIPHLIMYFFWFNLLINMFKIPMINRYFTAIIILLFILLYIRVMLKIKPLSERITSLFLSNENKRIVFIFFMLCILFFTLILIRSAWLCDDAYITFRTVDNFVNGYGLTWNTHERVQAYTNPLWMFLVSGVYAVTKEIYFTVTILSIVFTLIAVFIIIFKIARTPIIGLFSLVALVSSKIFIDYSTSGLENPLSYLLVVLFFLVFFNNDEKHPFRRLFLLSFLSCLSVINRMDTILIFIPSLLYALVKSKKIFKTLLIYAVGFLPFIAWEVFSIIYYGFPFPNTYYAKLNTGISKIEYIIKGLYYLLDLLIVRDQVASISIIASIIIYFRKRELHYLPIILGIIFYMFYVIWVGGDFMGGRFFTIPYLCSIIFLSRYEFNKIQRVFKYIAFVIMLGLICPFSPLLVDSTYPRIPSNEGICDERGFYYKEMGLLNVIRNNKIDHRWIERGKRLKESKTNVYVYGSIGFLGYYAGPNVKLIDDYALSNQFLSRIPHLRMRKYWRIGHLARYIPLGLADTVKYDKNQIVDKSLAQLYDKISIITQGNIFDKNRFNEIWNMNTGKYDYLVDKEFYKNPYNFYNDYIANYWVENILTPYQFGKSININNNNFVAFSEWNSLKGPRKSKRTSKILISLKNIQKKATKYKLKLYGKVYGDYSLEVLINRTLIMTYKKGEDITKKPIIFDNHLLRDKENIIEFNIPDFDDTKQEGFALREFSIEELF